MANLEQLERCMAGTDFSPYWTSFCLDAETRNLTTKSIAGYADHLCHFFRTLVGLRVVKLGAVTKTNIQQYILGQKGTVSDHTVNTRLRHIKSFLNYCVREELLDTSPMVGVKLLRAEKGPKPVVGPEIITRICRGLTGRKLRAFEAARNKAMVLIMWDSMLRLTETSLLKVADLNFEQKLLLVHGKGRKRRMVPVSGQVLRVVQRWLIKHRTGVWGDWLFCDRYGQLLKARNVRLIIERLGDKHRVHLTPHLIRHSAATWYIRNGGSLERLRLILGHSSLITTQNYLHLSASDLVEGHADLSPAKGLKL